MYKFIRGLVKILSKLMYRIKVEGKTDLPENGRYMICANHIHMFDPLLIMSNVKRPIAFMIKKELIKVPILGKLLLKCGAFPVDRGAGDIVAVKTAIEILNQDKVLSIFPEGTRHKDGKFRDVKKGAAMIAIRSNSPIIPMRIIGNYRLFSKMTLRISKPIDVAGYKKDELTEILKSEIEKLEYANGDVKLGSN